MASRFSRRELLLPLAFGFFPGTGGLNRLFLNSLVGEDVLSHNKSVDNSSLNENLIDLGRKFLIGASRQVVGIPSVPMPYEDVKNIPDSHRIAIVSIIQQLALFGDIEIKSSTIAPKGNIIIIGGPKNNYYSRLILGNGYGSPLLESIDSPDVFPVVFRESPRRSDKYDGGWEILVSGRRLSYNDRREYLVVHSMPNPYSDADGRITIIAGRRGRGTQAIGKVLGDRDLLESLLSQIGESPSWQILLPIEEYQNILKVSPDVQFFSVNYNHTALRNRLRGLPFLHSREGTGYLKPNYDPDRQPQRSAKLRTKPIAVEGSYKPLESYLVAGAGAAHARGGALRRPAPTRTEQIMHNSTAEKKNGQPANLPEWLVEKLPDHLLSNLSKHDQNGDDWSRIYLPDSNILPLNGEDPSDIEAAFGVEVRILRSDNPHSGGSDHSIVVSGPSGKISQYIAHLTSTWPVRQ